jgi:hypothetical protein
MDDGAGGRPRCQRPMPVQKGLALTISGSAGGVVAARMMVGVQASLLLLLLVGCAPPNWRGSGQQARDRQDIVAAHPAWSPEIRGAVASGVISAGMTSAMVRAAWGRPTRVSSSRSAWHQRDTWHYTERRHNTDVIGGQTGGAQPLGEWTVAFANGWVVGWTD